MAEQLQISRTTIVNTYDQLLAEGYLESKRGAGTFVAAHLPEEFLSAPDVEQQKNQPETPKRNLKLSRYGKNVSEESPTILRNSLTTPAIAFQHGLAAVEEFPFERRLAFFRRLCNIIASIMLDQTPHFHHVHHHAHIHPRVN